MQSFTIPNKIALIGAGVVASGALIASVVYFRKVSRYAYFRCD